MNLTKINQIYEVRKREILEKNKSFPWMIKNLREALGLKLNAVSNYCSISRHKLYRMETGQFNCVPDVRS